PLELLGQLESVLGIAAFPMNWPLGTGQDFAGVYDRIGKKVHFFERTAGGAYRSPVAIHALSDPSVREKLSDSVYQKVIDELEMLDIAGSGFDAEAVAAGKLTPVLFGSAINNFGIQLLLDTFLAHSTSPRSRHVKEVEIATDDPRFSGFVFKIQANMDPKHRDRIAFVRVCSGKFVRDIAVTHVQSGKRIRLSSSHKLFGQERETVDEAYAGDVIGLVGHSGFGIGDTVTEDAAIVYREIPRFAPETFAYLHSETTSQFKRFREGLEQLLQEGVIQSFQIKDSLQRVPLLGAVGPLQFEVVQYRLQTEYGAESRLEKAFWDIMRWLPPEYTPADLDKIALPSGAKLATDAAGRWVVLIPTEWALQYLQKQNPDLKLFDTPVEPA
ncbi:MAG TPA: EF-Tu/IF-2/RF-3 family GTPase, partial [Tepidisphaeraceae bacterium]